MPAPRIRTYTLGCKVNQYETEYVREGLLRAGYVEAGADEPASLCVVNTCTVTAEGDAKSRQVIRRLARQNPQARIVVMGCYATRAPREVASLTGVTEVVTDKRELPDLLDRLGVLDIPQGIEQFGDRQRAYVKVQDGCLLRCTYCVIPLVRPQMYSRDHREVIAEVQRLVANGYREIVLTGIHLGHYGVDRNRHRTRTEWRRLSHLVQELAELAGEFRLRLSSIEATEVTRDLLHVMAAYPDRICPHLHICLQSGSDDVLRRMNRRWGARRLVDRCELTRKLLDQPALTTDIMVGFPGETEEDFRATCQVARDCGFSKIHIFPFSARRHTPAAEFSGQVSKREKADRGRRLAELEAELRHDYFRSLLGRRLQVLVESHEDAATGQWSWGTSCRYAPVRLPATGGASGGLVEVRAERLEDRWLVAR